MYIDQSGYKRHTQSKQLLHRVIAKKSIYNPNKTIYKHPFSYYEIHHIDGNKKNNSVWNLEIVTHEEHTQIHRKGLI